MIEKLLRKATFATSAAQLNQIPKDSVCEVAFAGRSNSGKSSVINCLTGQKNWLVPVKHLGERNCLTILF